MYLIDAFLQKVINPISLNILRFKAKTMPQMKGKRQRVSNLDLLEGFTRLSKSSKNCLKVRKPVEKNRH